MAALLIPLLETMSVAARTAWPFIQRGVAEGLSANRIESALRSAGVGVRRQDVQALVREAASSALVRSDIKRLPTDIAMPADRVREAVTRIVGRFSYTLRILIEDAETGETFEETRQAHSDALEPFEDVARRFESGMAARTVYDAWDVQSVEVVDVVRAGRAGVL